MSPRPAFRLLLAAVLLFGGGWTHAITAPVQDPSLYLPVVQRNLPAHPQAALLHSIAAAGATRSEGDCDWEAGVLAWGWVKMWEATGDERYWEWTRTWVDGCIARAAKIEHVNGVPLAYAALSVYGRDPQPQYWALAEAARTYIFTSAPRTQDGTLIHLADMVWDDTLFGVVPFLVKMWRITGDSRCLDEAAAQVQKHAQHLQDPATGLFRHAWSEPSNGYTGPFFWGRGNGWVVLAQAELLGGMPSDDSRRPQLLSQYEQLVQALVAQQAPDGQWHTIITRPDFYTETSATALVAAALMLGVERRLLAEPLLSQARNAADAGRAAVWRQVGADGVVGGVSGPTGPTDQEQAYNDVARVDFALYGQGAALLAGAAVMPGP